MAASEPHFSPHHLLGRTGFRVTRIGVGDLADRTVPLEACVATLRRAFDAGLNIVDTAPSYEDGYSEQLVGRALRGRREGVFVVDKIDHHDQPVAPQVEGSLERLAMPATDAFLFHGVSKLDAWARLSAPGGGMEQLADCVRRGRTRFRGISSHNPDVLRAAVTSGQCDLVMFAIGPFSDPRYTREILPLARERGVGTIGIKAFGAGKLLGDTAGYGRPLQARPRGKQSSGGTDAVGEPELPRLPVADCVRYTLTIDADTALLGLSFPNEQDAAFAAARDARPMTQAELDDVRRRAAAAMRGKGDAWWNPASGQ